MRMMASTGSFTEIVCRRMIGLAIAATLLGVAPAQVRADTTDAVEQEDATEARSLFEQARTEVKQGNLEQALVFFRKSQRRYPAPGTLLNMADCEEKLGLVGSAWLHFHQLAIYLPVNDERASLASQREAALKDRVSWLRIDLASGMPRDTQVMRDGVPLEVFNLGVTLPVDPGVHALVVTAPGRQSRRYDLTVVEGKYTKAVVEAGPAEPPPATMP